ncbi:hypothetical protein HOLleu_22747 [Holothuria leucospilota]|uniref:Chitin-binding type-1 domain-containing protein n=1 Tax=Holothuria leucospilota TaxID=206669 RepID=A0A9Q1BZA4_HOLLE|nr:hypothetical protein HOLleu_22747 [Holothuria leucospilota]
MQWVSYDLPNDCDVILPGGFTESGLTELNKIWKPEMVKFSNSFHETTSMPDLTTPRSLLDEFSSTTMTADFTADRVQSRMLNVSFNISCKAVVDNTVYQPCDATLVSLIKGDAVDCAATTHSRNNETREECHIRLNVPEIYSGKPYRSDAQCGEGFLAPNGKVAECNPDEVSPCCSDVGWCGSTSDHCNCPKCIDFRTVGTTAVHSFCSNDVKDFAASQPMNISCNMREDALVSLPSCNETFPFSARNDGGSLTCTIPCSEYDATVGKCPLRVVIHG